MKISEKFTPFLFGLILTACSNDVDKQSFDPVPFDHVTISDSFWSSRIDSNRINGIPGCFNACNYSLVNFDIASGESKATRDGTLASDSDVYKIIQGVAHALDHTRDDRLESFTDSLISRIAAAQEPDGYLDTYFSILYPSMKWINEEQNHELYCAGHLFEAAADYYRVTGKRQILDVAIRLADHIDRKFGKGKLEEVSGHEEIELALISLYEVTGENRYLRLAEFFLEERGNPERLKRKANPGENDPNAKTPERYRKPEYRQDHLPPRDQRTAVGHAVRAAYLYCGMADLARTTGSGDYLPALESISNDIITRKIYVTGATGTSEYSDEGFGSGSLKNHEAYCETCSSIALMLWNYRMNNLTGDAKYADLFELTLYNGGLSGVSLSGNRFFYVNPLESTGQDQRDAWFEPGCCPSNMVRFIPQIDRFIYGQKDDRIYVNQFIGSHADISIDGKPVRLEQSSGYLSGGKVTFRVKLEKMTRMSLFIRIPAWARGRFFPGGLYQYASGSGDALTEYPVLINGERQTFRISSGGYMDIRRKWNDGDRIEIGFAMPVRIVQGNPVIQDVAGQGVITRGPVVYCFEAVDNPKMFGSPGMYHPDKESFRIADRPGFPGGIPAIEGSAVDSTGNSSVPFTAIPYYAWCNRGPTSMRVWWDIHW